MKYKSLADIFKDPNSVYNDPLHEIHNPVQRCNSAPELYEYDDFLTNLDCTAYPMPVDKKVHNIVNPLHKKLKPVMCNYK